MNNVLKLDPEQDTFFSSFTPSSIVKKLPFYLLTSGYFYQLTRYQINRDRYHNYLLLYTLSGEGLLKYSGREYRVVPGTFMLINCEFRHLYKTNRHSHWEFVFFHINGSALQGLFELFGKELVFAPKNLIKINKIVKALLSFKSDGMLTQSLECNDLLNKLFCELILQRNINIVVAKPKIHQNIELTLTYIETNFQHEITLDSLCSVAYLSKFYFIRLFKAHTGITPNEYILNYRINHAKFLLNSTAMSISEICFACGFNSENHFIKTFKKITGQTPRNYQKTYFGS
jgi:AraC-like DNA-binding protein